jgi:transposase
LWVPTAEQRDLRQLLIHRHKLVEIRTRVKNGLQHLALNRGLQKKSGLWSVRGRAYLEKLPLDRDELAVFAVSLGNSRQEESRRGAVSQGLGNLALSRMRAQT